MNSQSLFSCSPLPAAARTGWGAIPPSGAMRPEFSKGNGTRTPAANWLYGKTPAKMVEQIPIKSGLQIITRDVWKMARRNYAPSNNQQGEIR
jgi:hypothetical protein